MKYILHPGWVTKTNGSWRWISGKELSRLYHIPWDQCFLFHRSIHRIKPNSPDIHLYPRKDGNYTLPIMDPKTEVRESIVISHARQVGDKPPVSLSMLSVPMPRYLGETFQAAVAEMKLPVTGKATIKIAGWHRLDDPNAKQIEDFLTNLGIRLPAQEEVEELRKAKQERDNARAYVVALEEHIQSFDGITLNTRVLKELKKILL